MTQEVNIEHVFEQAYSALSDTDQVWLSKEKFDILCNAVASGVTHRNLYKALGQTRKLLRGQKADQTRRFKIIFTTPVVKAYINLIEDPDTMSWSDWLEQKRQAAQNVLDAALDFGDKGPTKEAIKLATRILEQEVGKPKERIQIEESRTVTFPQLAEIADQLPAHLFLPPPGGDAEVVDVEVVDVGDGERGTGEAGRPGDSTLHPEPGAVDGSPVPQPAEVDGGRGVGREEQVSGP